MTIISLSFLSRLPSSPQLIANKQLIDINKQFISPHPSNSWHSGSKTKFLRFVDFWSPPLRAIIGSVVIFFTKTTITNEQRGKQKEEAPHLQPLPSICLRSSEKLERLLLNSPVLFNTHFSFFHPSSYEFLRQLTPFNSSSSFGKERPFPIRQFMFEISRKIFESTTTIWFVYNHPFPVDCDGLFTGCLFFMLIDNLSHWFLVKNSRHFTWTIINSWYYNNKGFCQKLILEFMPYWYFKWDSQPNSTTNRPRSSSAGPKSFHFEGHFEKPKKFYRL